MDPLRGAGVLQHLVTTVLLSKTVLVCQPRVPTTYVWRALHLLVPSVEYSGAGNRAQGCHFILQITECLLPSDGEFLLRLSLRTGWLSATVRPVSVHCLWVVCSQKPLPWLLQIIGFTHSQDWNRMSGAGCLCLHKLLSLGL